MNKFIFNSISEDGVINSIAFDAECWPDTFPHYLNMLRGAGYSIPHEVMLLVPEVLSGLAESRDYMVIDTEVHSDYYYDTERNK